MTDKDEAYWQSKAKEGRQALAVSMAEARRNRWHELKRQPFTAEEKAHWIPMMHATWQAIGPDAETSMDDVGEELTNALVVELVFDANRIMDYGGMTKEEYEFVGAIYATPAFQKWAAAELNYY